MSFAFLNKQKRSQYNNQVVNGNRYYTKERNKFYKAEEQDYFCWAASSSLTKACSHRNASASLSAIHAFSCSTRTRDLVSSTVQRSEAKGAEKILSTMVPRKKETAHQEAKTSLTLTENEAMHTVVQQIGNASLEVRKNTNFSSIWKPMEATTFFSSSPTFPASPLNTKRCAARDVPPHRKVFSLASSKMLSNRSDERGNADDLFCAMSFRINKSHQQSSNSYWLHLKAGQFLSKTSSLLPPDFAFSLSQKFRPGQT